MVGKTKAPTATQKRRMTRIKEIGCIVCRELGLGRIGCEVHHLIDGYRKGHDYTLGLCCWHHRGQPWTFDLRPSEMEDIAGPSLARNKRAFVSEFGSEDELLERQNYLLKEAA